MKGALFICLGNICRSPIAEACFKQILTRNGSIKDWKVDSAATSQYQIGNPPDERGCACMESHGVYHLVENHRARQITAKDYDEFDFIFGMDKNNMRDLEKMAPKKPYKAKLLLLGSFDDDETWKGIINDPYFGSDDKDFDVVFEQCLRSCRNFLKSDHV